MTTEKLVLSILNGKAADAKSLFEEIIASKVEALTEERVPETASMMLDEETEAKVNYFNDVHNYFNHLLEDGHSVDDAVKMLSEDEDVGPEVTEQYLQVLSSYLEENGPEDPEEDEEECEDEEEADDEYDESGDNHKDATP